MENNQEKSKVDEALGNTIYYINDFLNLIAKFKAIESYNDKLDFIDNKLLKSPRNLEICVQHLRSALKQSLLRPCPFCGSRAELRTEDGGDYDEDSWTVECTNCCCSLSIGHKSEVTESEAIEVWNTRK